MSQFIKICLLIFEELSSLVFPLSEDEQRIRKTTIEDFLQKLNLENRGEVVVLSSFKDPVVRAAIHLVKFHHHPKALQLTSALFANWIEGEMKRDSVVIMPIPLSTGRLRERGFNQTEIIVRAAIAQLPNATVNTSLLIRQRHTVPQSSLNRKERLKNVVGAFSVNRDQSLRGVHIILFDDVSTTGATLQAAKAALLPLSPATITCVSLAG